MIYDLRDEYSQDLLLSEFSLKNNCLDKNFINSLFLSPILKNITILDKNNTLKNQDFWIAFKEFRYDAKTPKKEMYKKMHNDMKTHVKNEWCFFENSCALYTSHFIEAENNIKKYLCLYLSPKKSEKTFDFSIIKKEKYLMESIFDILLKGVFLEDLTKHTAFADIHSGKILLKPKVIKNTVSGYSYKLIYDNYNLSFELGLKRYVLKEESDIAISDDVCFNRRAYGKQISAQELISCARKFMNFENYNLANESLFVTQIDLFKKIEKMLVKFNLDYECKTFKPQYLNNEFTKFDNLDNANLWVINSCDDITDDWYEKDDYLLNLFDGLKVAKKKGKDIGEFIKYKKEPNIVVMITNSEHNSLDEVENENYIYEIDKFEKKYYDSSLAVFIERDLDKLSYESFLSAISKFDLYSQVKIYNLYAHSHNIEPIISQGLILNSPKNGVFSKSEMDEIKNKIKKVIKEISLKNLLLNKLPMEINVAANLIQIIQKTTEKNKDLYSYCSLVKTENGNFKLSEGRLLNSSNLNTLNLDVCFEDEFMDADTLIFFDECYLLKNIKNTKNPSIVLRKDVLNQENDPTITIQRKIDEQSSLNPVSRTLSDKGNICYFPYLSCATGKMSTQKPKNLESQSAFCIFQIEKELLKTFVRPSIHSINKSVLKQSRIENVILKKKYDLFYEDESWDGNISILEGYLSTLTLNQLIINSVSKKSILTKFSEIIMFN